MANSTTSQLSSSARLSPNSNSIPKSATEISFDNKNSPSSSTSTTPPIPRTFTRQESDNSSSSSKVTIKSIGNFVADFLKTTVLAPRAHSESHAEPALQEKLTSQERQYRELLAKEAVFRKETKMDSQGNNVNTSTAATASSTTSHFPQQPNDEQLCIETARVLNDNGVKCEEMVPDSIWWTFKKHENELPEEAWLHILKNLNQVQSYKIEINYRGIRESSTVHLAAKKGYCEVMKLLLTFPDVNFNIRNGYNETALHIAAEEGNFELVKIILTASNIEVNAMDCSYNTALIQAARNGHSAVVALLAVVKGIDVNATNGNNYTALCLATENGHVESLRILLTIAGIAVNTKNVYGSAAIHWATRNGDLESVRLLLASPRIDINAADGCEETALYIAAKAPRANSELVGLILCAPGINVNAKSGVWPGATALHELAVNGDYESVKLLLKAPGIDVNAHNSYGITPLYCGNAMKWGAPENPFLDKGAFRRSLNSDLPIVKEYIVQRTGPAKQLDSYGLLLSALPTTDSSTSALQLLALREVQKTLLAGEFDSASVANVLERAALTPYLVPLLVPTLALASTVGHYECTKKEGALDDAIPAILKKSGQWDAFLVLQEQFIAIQAHINCYLEDGSTALTRAAKTSNLPLLTLLVKGLNADLRLPDRHGDNAISVAAKHNQWAACSELLSLGANPYTSDADGYPALYYVAKAFSNGGGDTAENRALAYLIRQARIRGYHFNYAVANHDESSKYEQPWINIADILASNPEQILKYATIIYQTS